MNTPIIFGDSHCRNIQRETVFKPGRRAETAKKDADWITFISKANNASAVTIVLGSNDIQKRLKQFDTPHRAAKQVVEDLMDIKSSIPNQKV